MAQAAGAPAQGHGPGGANAQGNGQGHGHGHDSGGAQGNGKGSDQGNASQQPTAAPATPAPSPDQGNGNGSANAHTDNQSNGNGNGKGHGKGDGKGHQHGADAAPTTVSTPAATITPTQSTLAPAVPATPATLTTAAIPAAPTAQAPSASAPSTTTTRLRTHSPDRRVAAAVATNGVAALGFGAAGRTPLTTALASGTAKSLGALRTAALRAGTLAASGAAGGRSPGEAGRLRSLHRHRATHASFLPSLALPAKTVIRFISVIPLGVWLALAVSLGIAGVAGAAAVRSGRRARRHAGEVAAVTAAALLDPLTGVLNRRGFSAAVERELARAHRYDHPLALAFVDVRGLKAVNDSEGHLAGDRLLKQVGMLLTDSARAHDVVGRIGGDELAVLLVEQSEDGAAAMTRRVRAEIGRHRAALGLRTPWDLTVGTSVFPRDGETFDELLAVADRRLYEQRGIELRAASAADAAGLAAAGASHPQARS